MTEVSEILEALDLKPAEPGVGYLQSLFTRFNERVPFESASKIVRHAEVQDPAEEPRVPEIFWADHLALGAGGTCFARVAAFEALLAGLNFDCRIVLGRVENDFDHAALLARAGGEEWLADVGFPLPALLPGREGETETAHGPVRVTRTDRGYAVEMLEGVPVGPRRVEIFDGRVAREEFGRHWRATFRAESRFLKNVSLRVERGERTVSFGLGEIRVDDLHSRTRIPVPAPRARALEEQFGVDRELLDRAFALVGDPESAIPGAQVSVYLSVGIGPREAFARIATPGGYGELMAGAARVTPGDSAGEGWRVRLSPREAPDGAEGAGNAASVDEEIVPDSVGFALRVTRGGRRSSYEAVSANGRTFLVRRLELDGPRLELLRNDSLRGRIAGTLAVDLLAWARLLSR